MLSYLSLAMRWKTISPTRCEMFRLTFNLNWNRPGVEDFSEELGLDLRSVDSNMLLRTFWELQIPRSTVQTLMNKHTKVYDRKSASRYSSCCESWRWGRYPVCLVLFGLSSKKNMFHQSIDPKPAQGGWIHSWSKTCTVQMNTFKIQNLHRADEYIQAPWKKLLSWICPWQLRNCTDIYYGLSSVLTLRWSASEEKEGTCSQDARQRGVQRVRRQGLRLPLQRAELRGLQGLLSAQRH